MEQTEAHALTAAYVLNALEADEEVEAERHLAACAMCREELPALLDERGIRQALHVTFGAVLTDPIVRARLEECLERHAATYAAALERHLARHLELLAPAA